MRPGACTSWPGGCGSGGAWCQVRDSPWCRRAPGLPAPLWLQRVSSAKMTHCNAVREGGQKQREGGTQQLDREPRLLKDGSKTPGAEPILP